MGIVEIYYSYWKIKNHGSVEEYVRNRANVLPNYSWLFLDETDVKSCEIEWKLLEFVQQLKYHRECGCSDMQFIMN